MPVIKHLDNKSVDQTVAKFNSVAQQTVEEAKREHGSSLYAGTPKFDKHARDYGRPLIGTKSQARGVRGGEHVMREVIFLCEMIEKNGAGTPPNCFIKFGPLFYMYSRISETLVGMLIRARKYGLVDFEGEMLYQRQDDHKPVRLLMTSEEIREKVQYSGDPVNVIKLNCGKSESMMIKTEEVPPAEGKKPPSTQKKPEMKQNTEMKQNLEVKRAEMKQNIRVKPNTEMKPNTGVKQNTQEKKAEVMQNTEMKQSTEKKQNTLQTTEMKQKTERKPVANTKQKPWMMPFAT